MQTMQQIDTWQESRRPLPAGLQVATVVLDMPSDLYDRLDRLETKVAALQDLLETRPVTSSTLLRDLNSDAYILKEAISIVIEEYPEEAIARWPEVEVWGNGDTQGEAISRLKKRILERYEDVVTMEPATMGRLVQSWKRILMGVIYHQ